jgi:hypothetical protein
MAEVLFISDVYIKKYTIVNGAVDPNLLYPSVYLSQDKYLAPYLGDSLFEKLKDDIANNTLAGNYQTLVDDYCRKVVLWWTMVEAIPSLTYKLDNATLVQRTSEDATPISDTVMKDAIDRAKSNAETYTKRLVDYLCANSQLFPEYSNNVWPQRSPIGSTKSSSNFIFSNGNSATNTRGTQNGNLLSKLP